MSTKENKRYNDLGIDFKYLLVNEKDKSYGLTVNTVGFQPIRANSEYPCPKHPKSYFFNPLTGRVLSEYQILYISKGEGHFQSEDTKRTKVHKGQAIILFPGQWHSYCPCKETGWNEYYIGFEGQFADQIVSNNFISPDNQILNPGVSEKLVQLFSNAINAAKNDKPFSQQHLAGIVMNILGVILSSSQDNSFENDKSSEMIERAKIIMRENIRKDVNVKQIAEKLSVSYSWFRKVFKEYTGFAPSQYLQQLKLREAKMLLSETDHSIKEISYDLNFSSD